MSGNPVHERAVLWREGEYLIVVDRVTGGGAFPIASYLHFHPMLVPREDGRGRWAVDVQGSPLWVLQIGNDEARIEKVCEHPSIQGWYSERFGEKRQNTVLSFHTHAALPYAAGYAFSSSKEFTCSIERDGVNVKLTVNSAQGACNYRISKDAVECFA
jgi:hypothetical protein